MRLASDQALERGGDSDTQKRWLSGALALLGLLIVLWTMINIGSIETWLVRAQTATVSANDDLWYGPQAATFAGLLDQVGATEFGPSEIQEFMSADNSAAVEDGVYVVLRQTPLGISQVATAAISHVDDHLYFAGALRDGGEIRGIARPTGTAYSADWGSAALLHEGQYYAVAGVAIRQANGSFECYGQDADSEISYDLVAYRVPELAEQ
ncbi:MAG: hypothetical protein IT368_10920 [Candidatus Hydrogenedentes bacterium]|nr:hypothetical protein [Candidatus Hydrogenedentota bacterium]